MARTRHIAKACLLLVPWNVSAKASEPPKRPDEGVSKASSQKADNASYRISLPLGSARKYATRYIPARRALEIRIYPAKAAEFATAENYDSAYVHRLVIMENNREVVLSLQLKNEDMGWLVTHKDRPWRIIIDLWHNAGSDPGLAQETETPWNWEGLNSSDSLKMMGANLARHEVFEGTDGGEDLDILTREQGAASNRAEGAAVNPWEEGSETEAARAMLGTQPAQASRPRPQDDLSEPVAGNPGDSAFAADEPMGRFLRTRDARSGSGLHSSEGSAKARARAAFEVGAHNTAFSLIRREAALRRREFLSDPEAIWLGGESAYMSGRPEVARDYFLTLSGLNEVSSYTALANLRLTDLDVLAKKETLTSAAERYREMALNEQIPWLPRIVSLARILQGAEKPDEFIGDPFLEVIGECVRSDDITTSIQQGCAYQDFLHKMRTDDIVTAQGTIEEYANRWPADPRIAVHKDALRTQIKDFLRSSAEKETFQDWLRFEKASRPEYLSAVNTDAGDLETRARAYERAGDLARALELYEKAAANSKDSARSTSLLARAANLATKTTNAARAQTLLEKIKSQPNRSTEGLGAEAVGYVREIALPPYSNNTALSLLLDEIFTGFHAENDIRTLVSLTERLNGSREADVLYEKILALPTRSLAESELKEETLLEYAEVLRNQGRLVKSADMFLAVANLDNGKNRAEAAYKAGVVYFRAGLLEKATASWNLAANDLANSKYSALATERLNRIR